MKKIVLSLAFVIGFGIEGLFASTISPSIDVAITDDGFKPIKKEKLPQEIKDTLTKDFNKQSVTAAAISINRSEGRCIYQVTLKNDMNEELILLFDEKGKVINQYQ